MSPRAGRRLLRGQGGMALADVLIGMLILALVAVWGMDMFAANIAQTRTSGIHAEGAVWAQAEVDYLRGLGYRHACLGAGSRTISSASTPCTPLEPALPAAFAQARLEIEDAPLGQSRLKRITLELHRPAGTVLYRVVTYATDFE